MMLCKNCGHEIEKSVEYWKEQGMPYSHKRKNYEIHSLGFTGKKQINYLKTCFCGCKKPEPKESEK